MHVFVTGGSGLTGPAIVAELISAGHRVTGLARSDEAADRLRRSNAKVLRGTLADDDALREGATDADGVVHMAFSDNRADPVTRGRLDLAAINVLGQALVETGKPLVSTSAILALTPGIVSTEEDSADPASLGNFRIPGERACLAFARRGVRSSVVRLAPTVHGPGDYGFIPFLINTARRTGMSAYIGDGANRWPAIHRQDAAVLFRLALEEAPAGSVLHGVGESAITMEVIARQIARKLLVPTVALLFEEAVEHFQNAFLAKVLASDVPASNARTRRLLGWAPAHGTLLEDLETGDYFSTQLKTPF